jgi:hypothetical protein
LVSEKYKQLSSLPDAGNVAVEARLRVDERCLRDQQCSGGRCSLAIVLHTKVLPKTNSAVHLRALDEEETNRVDVLVVCSESGQGCEHDTVPKLDRAELEGLEELRSLSSGTHGGY